MTRPGPRYPARRRDPLRNAVLAPLRSATGPHAIKTIHGAGWVRAACACGWRAEKSRAVHIAALADGAKHIGRVTKEKK